MPGEVARSGVKHPGPRARVARKPTPATRTILYYGLGFFSSPLLHHPHSWDILHCLLLQGFGVYTGSRVFKRVLESVH